MHVSDEAVTESSVIVRRTIRRTAERFGVVLQPACVEDLAQDTYVALLERGTSAGVRSFPAYASRVARNLTIDRLRRRRATRRDEGKTDSLGESEPSTQHLVSPEEEVLARLELLHYLKLLRQLLSPRVIGALILIHGLGYTSSEAGVRLGISPSGVDSLLHRARLKLKSRGVQFGGQGA